ncbi:hypothetical protein FRB99_004341 [Tulasnella sp. 403]|nr:hypothetical protein FRB99_004341 [Tulasnella sp. 403]
MKAARKGSCSVEHADDAAVPWRIEAQGEGEEMSQLNHKVVESESEELLPLVHRPNTNLATTHSNHPDTPFIIGDASDSRSKEPSSEDAEPQLEDSLIATMVLEIPVVDGDEADNKDSEWGVNDKPPLPALESILAAAYATSISKAGKQTQNMALKNLECTSA